MQSRQCTECGKAFRPRPQVPQQCYCGEAACQRARRRRWQRAKRVSDADYRDNQARAQQGWLERHRDYWSEYRRTHLQYVERNRVLQRRRNARRGARVIAKMDASTPVSPVPSGTYRLTPAVTPEIAKMDAWTVEITVLSKHSARQAADCKERT